MAEIFFRGQESIESQLGFGPLRQIVDNFVRPITTISLMIYLAQSSKKRRYLVPLIVIFLATNPITGMARWSGGSTYIAVSMVAFRRLFFVNNVQIYALSVGGFLLLPLLDLFRYFNGALAYKFSTNWVFHGNFDSFQNFANVVRTETVTFGHQLLGVILFFIPRSIWADKPVGSGHLIARKMDLLLENISMNYFGEGYINFGVLGTIFFSIILGRFCGQLDRLFWISKVGDRFIDYFYYFFISSIVFLLRGDLLSSYAYLSGFFVSSWFVYFLVRRNSYQ